jgi:hypothetical protein
MQLGEEERAAGARRSMAMRPRCCHRGELINQRPKRGPPSFFNAATKRISWRNEQNLGAAPARGRSFGRFQHAQPPPRTAWGEVGTRLASVYARGEPKNKGL